MWDQTFSQSTLMGRKEGEFTEQHVKTQQPRAPLTEGSITRCAEAFSPRRVCSSGMKMSRVHRQWQVQWERFHLEALPTAGGKRRETQTWRTRAEIHIVKKKFTLCLACKWTRWGIKACSLAFLLEWKHIQTIRLCSLVLCDVTKGTRPAEHLSHPQRCLTC